MPYFLPFKKTKSSFLGIAHLQKKPYLCTRKQDRGRLTYIPASAGKHGIKATDKRETVIAHIIPYILYNKVKIPSYIYIPKECARPDV